MKPTIRIILTGAAMALAAKGAVISGSVSTFSGPDDLLLDPSTNVVAVDSFGSNGSLTVNGVAFQSDSASGTVTGGGASVTTTSTNSIDGWQTAPTYTGADNNPILNGVIIHRTIPEPGSLIFLGIGLSSLFLKRRRS